MKLIVRGRQSGKTTELIKMSAKTGALIVCRNFITAEMINQRALEMELKIPFPLTYNEFKDGRHGLGVDLLIDDGETLIRQMSSSHIAAITMTDEGEEF